MSWRPFSTAPKNSVAFLASDAFERVQVVCLTWQEERRRVVRGFWPWSKKREVRDREAGFRLYYALPAGDVYTSDGYVALKVLADEGFVPVWWMPLEDLPPNPETPE